MCEIVIQEQMNGTGRNRMDNNWHKQEEIVSDGEVVTDRLHFDWQPQMTENTIDQH